MKFAAHHSLWSMALLGCGALASTACGSDAGSTPDDVAGSAGAATAGAGTGVAGSAAGSGGAIAAGGASAGAPAAVAGAPSAGSGGAPSGGSGGAATAGAGGASAGAGGSSTVGPFGVQSCQPAFEQACKPDIEFVNGDPTGRGKVFTDAVPDVTATMKDVACIVCSMLYRTASEIPTNKHPSKIRLVLDTHGGVAQAGGNQIQFDLNYIQGIGDDNKNNPAAIKQEMMGVLQHETVHLYQNYGNGGTGEGEADLVRTRKGYYPRSRWTKGGSWKDAYTTSGFFYSWLTGPCEFHKETLPAHDLNFPYKLNKALANKSGDDAYTAVNDLLKATFNRDADSLWKEYQDTAF